jgi:succinate-semialdehyde dehydrogenase / glutarate-semialdehyde dehydrogenase
MGTSGYPHLCAGELKAIASGDPSNDETTLGPSCTANALKLVESQIKTAAEGGATVVLAGKQIDRPGYLLEPTSLSNIKPGNSAYYQELCAPVALMFRENEQEAIALANGSPFGLGGSVITKDIGRGKRIARQIETGMVFINAATSTAPELPFGGIKNSGYGRELTVLGIGEFVNKKLIRVA